MADLKIDDLPALTASSRDDIYLAHHTVLEKFHSHGTRSLQYRLKQLKSFYWGVKDAEPALLEACRLDLGKSAYEAYLAEVGWVLNDILFMISKLAQFTKDEKAQHISLLNKPMRPFIRKDPLGVVLIIGAYNFPIQLSLGPLIGAISAGCTAVLKPSENAPNAARVVQHILERSLDQAAYRCVQGGITEATDLLNCKWDKIFYTGNATVGKIIATKAAETLTPITLELGGRNPAVVTKNANLRLAARRLLWAKVLNAGQICVSQNYVMVEKTVLPDYLKETELALKEFLPCGAKTSPDYGKIVNERQWQKLKDMLDGSNGEVVLGGNAEKATLFFEPTVVLVKDANDTLLREESFGPLIPILAYSNIEEAIRTVNTVHNTPLGLYTFGSKQETDQILSQTRSGGVSLNDGFFHAAIPTLEFGGVGDSGQGTYRGRASFDCFTHRRAVTRTPGWIESLLDIRYPPFTDGKLKRLKFLQDGKPNFDREGRPKGAAWVLWMLGHRSA